MKLNPSNREDEFRVVVLGSGRGSNAEAILRSGRQGNLGRAKVVAVFADSPGPSILDIAAVYGVPCHYLSPGRSRAGIGKEQENMWIRAIQFYRPDLIVLAGFMRIVRTSMLDAFDGKVINIHPSLLPKWPGLNSIQRAFEAGDREIGCTVHWVTGVVDGGEVIGQATVAVDADDTLESLTEKLHAAEHKLLPSVIADLSAAG